MITLQFLVNLTFDVDCFIDQQWNHDWHRGERQGRTGGLQWSALPVKNIVWFHDTLSNMSTIVYHDHRLWVSHRFGLFSDHDERLNAELSCCAGLLPEPLGDPPALEPSSTRKVRWPLLHSPPQLHYHNFTTTTAFRQRLRNTRHKNFAHLRPPTLIQRALKSDPPVSLSCANLYKGTGRPFQSCVSSWLQTQKACVSFFKAVS